MVEVIGPAALLALAAVIIALALQIEWPVRSARPALVTLATVAAMIGAPGGSGSCPSAARCCRRRCSDLAALWGSPAICHQSHPLCGPARVPGRLSLAPADRAGVLSTYLWTHLRPSLIRARFPLLLACFAGMAFW